MLIPELFIGEFGDASAVKAVQTAFADDLGKAGLLSLPITLAILVIAFGALVAAGIPLLLALTAIFATFGLIAIPSHILPVAQQAPALVLLIGLAVGVDYSMFYLRREREERAAGRSERAAIEAAAATSGRSVLISGLTVMTAMAGMFLTGDQIFESFGVATILVVAIAMLGSLTVLPALLSRLGDGVGRGRVPLVSRLRRDDGDGRIWGAIIDRVLRRPLLSAVLAGGFLLLLAVPAIQLKMAQAGPDTFPKSLAVVKTYDRMQGAFPGTAMAANVVVQAPNVKSPQMQSAISRLEQRALASGRMYRPFTVDVNQAGTVADITVPIEGKGSDAESNASLALLRNEIVPKTVGALPGTEAGVTGFTAQWKDSKDDTKANLPPVVAFVLLFAFVLMLVAFRSLVIAAKAIVLNLLSVGRGLRRPGARLPARLRQEPVRVHLDGRDRPGGSAAPVRDPVRALDGLSRVPPEPDPRGGPAGRVDRRGRRAGNQVDGRRRHERRARHGRRVLRLHRALDAVLQAVRRRSRGRDPDRRDDRPRRAPARVDEAARRLELVPPQLARVAARPRRVRGRHSARDQLEPGLRVEPLSNPRVPDRPGGSSCFPYLGTGL